MSSGTTARNVPDSQHRISIGAIRGLPMTGSYLVEGVCRPQEDLIFFRPDEDPPSEFVQPPFTYITLAEPIAARIP